MCVSNPVRLVYCLTSKLIISFDEPKGGGGGLVIGLDSGIYDGFVVRNIRDGGTIEIMLPSGQKVETLN